MNIYPILSAEECIQLYTCYVPASFFVIYDSLDASSDAGTFFQSDWNDFVLV